MTKTHFDVLPDATGLDGRAQTSGNRVGANEVSGSTSSGANALTRAGDALLGNSPPTAKQP